jgi:hypothetical protein
MLTAARAYPHHEGLRNLDCDRERLFDNLLDRWLIRRDADPHRKGVDDRRDDFAGSRHPSGQVRSFL